MRRSIHALFSICLFVIFIAACNGQDSSGKEANYETTKKMVVDILQTEDGKKALTEILSDEKLKKQLVIESDLVQDSINNVLVSEKGAEMWKNLFKDPSFVKDYAKSLEDEQKKLMKSLMNDAEYQKQMIEILQNPEISEHILSLIKSQQFRAHLEETIQQTLETPLFQEKMKETLLKAAEKQGQEKGKEGEQQGGGGEGSESGSEGE
ncbi:spore germination lipoprotein GerD [Virgibacillus sp. W0430]|uniref:spore germination lipoprotein GerD n=1 Tax=Virgibacillus sp. W0430 TaxID=3391580 RepID=UPI003F472A1E